MINVFFSQSLKPSALCRSLVGVSALALVAACGQSNRDAPPAPEPQPVPEIVDTGEAAPVEPAAASTEDDGHSGEAHEHGKGDLAIVLEDKLLTIALFSPMYNIVGFEHAPKDAEQEAALTDAQRLIEDGDRLFGLTAAAGCVFEGADISYDTEISYDGSGDGYDPSPEAGEGESDPNEHGDEHDHGEHEGHEHGEKGGGGYRDLDVSWTWTCATPDALDTVEVRLFEEFPRFERMPTVTYNGEISSADTLGADSATVSLPRE